jgi:hypothetical protein
MSIAKDSKRFKVEPTNYATTATFEVDAPPSRTIWLEVVHDEGYDRIAVPLSQMDAIELMAWLSEVTA